MPKGAMHATLPAVELVVHISAERGFSFTQIFKKKLSCLVNHLSSNSANCIKTDHILKGKHSEFKH